MALATAYMPTTVSGSQCNAYSAPIATVATTASATPDDPLWEERDEEGQKFIVWHRVVPVQVTRYIWKTKE